MHLLIHDPARPKWQDIALLSLEQGSGVVELDGTLSAAFFVASVADTFDVVVDGNQDGHYQPWADNVVTIIVDAPTDIESADPPRETRLAGMYPNPMRGTTTVSFSLHATSAATLRVYDVAGRLVRTLESRVLAPNHYARRWDGRTDSGESVAAGIYFVSLQTGTTRQTQKIVRMH